MSDSATLPGRVPPTQAITLLSPAESRAVLRAASARGMPLFPWDGVQPGDWRRALLLIESCTRAALAGEHGTLVLESERMRAAFGAAAFSSGMGPLLGWGVQHGLIGTDPQTATLLALHLEHARARWQRMAQELRAVVAAFHAHGIPTILMKGADTAHTVFPEPALRPMADVDLLLPPASAALAEQLLRDAGCSLVPGSDVRRPYRTDWLPPSSSRHVECFTVHTAGNPFNIDLHTSLDVRFFGVRTIRFDVPPPDSLQPAPYAGTGARLLPRPLLTAHVAAHASRGMNNLTLIRVLELVHLLRALGRQGQAEQLVPLLRRHHAQRFVYPAVELAERLAPGTVLPELRRELAAHATPALRRIVRGVNPATAQGLDRVRLDERFMWGSGVLDHVRRVAHMLAPHESARSPRKLATIYGGRLLRIVRGRTGWRG